MAGAFGQFTFRACEVSCFSRTAGLFIQRTHGAWVPLSCEELATLWHPATPPFAPQHASHESRELEPPVTLPIGSTERDIAVLGRVKFRSRKDIFGIRADDRRRHLAVSARRAWQDHLAPATHRLRHAGKSRLALVVLTAIWPMHSWNTFPTVAPTKLSFFDAGDRDFPLAFNPLACLTSINGRWSPPALSQHSRSSMEKVGPAPGAYSTQCDPCTLGGSGDFLLPFRGCLPTLPIAGRLPHACDP